MVAANDRLGLTFCLSPGQADDGKNGQRLLQNWGHDLPKIPLAMDRARVRIPVRSLKNQAFEPVAPPKSNRLKPWFYDKTIYKRPN